MKILGISAYYHDSAAALIVDGEIIAAAQEERFTRKKQDDGFPVHAARFCLDFAGLNPRDIDFVAFYDKPFIKFERLLETYLQMAPRGFQSFRTALPIWVKDKLFQRRMLVDGLNSAFGLKNSWADKLRFTEHHLSHAASAFYPSPFNEAAILTMDGVGEWATTSLAMGSSRQIDMLKEIRFPHSLGLLYSAFTYYTGFKVNSGEYKVMGLAPYGRPVYADKIRQHLIDIKPDGSFRLNMEYFDYCTGLTMTNDRFHRLFEGEPRQPETWMTQREMDLAASIQDVAEDIVLKLGRSIAKETGARNLCLAGGVALNCVANGKLLRDGCFDKIWIQPAAGDAGGALGAALAVHHLHAKKERIVSTGLDAMKGAYLGPSDTDQEIRTTLDKLGAVYSVTSPEEVANRTAKALADGKAVGWHQGRMEFGPRALGGRSILGDARSPAMQKLLNLKVKYRESFRPFAPSVLAEDVSAWFDLDAASPYMLLVADVKDQHRIAMTSEQEALFGIDKLNVTRSAIPAVTHVDYSARIQTVHKETNPAYYNLIQKFKELTGCAVIVNTSFNVRGEPIVCTPEDSFRCFMGTELDWLVIGNFILEKSMQKAELKERYETKFALD